MNQPETFNRKILAHWTQWVNQPYDSELNRPEKNWIQQNLSNKLGYWADSIIKKLDGWEKVGRRDFLNRNRDRFRHYMWLKVFETGRNPELYFTLSISHDAGNGIPGLVIKLDFQRSSPKHLNPIQHRFLTQQLKRNIDSAGWCNIENYESLTWDQLIELSTSFIQNHLGLYEKLSEKLENLAGEYRLARLCWNPNGWIEPSGSKGKSLDKNSHEYQYGFGHEEWIFDTSKLVDGFHYSFLEPIFKTNETYLGRKFNIGLYTIDSDTKNRYWIGIIKNVEVINLEASNLILKKYKDYGWYSEMISQIEDLGINDVDLMTGTDGQLFNIKFRPEDMDILDYELISKHHPIYTISRYTFLKSQNIIDTFISEPEIHTGFIPRNGEPNDSGVISSYLREPKMVQVRKKHQGIQKKLYQNLVLNYGKDNVTWEFLTENRTQVDLVRKDQDKLIFYEIKTYPSIRVSIREALGQLLEYAHWVERPESIEFVIVTDLPINDSVQKYISALIHIYNIPITYAWFDISNNQLVEYEFTKN